MEMYKGKNKEENSFTKKVQVLVLTKIKFSQPAMLA
jgi:hypothetical protein